MPFNYHIDRMPSKISASPQGERKTPTAPNPDNPEFRFTAMQLLSIRPDATCPLCGFDFANGTHMVVTPSDSETGLSWLCSAKAHVVNPSRCFVMTGITE